MKGAFPMLSLDERNFSNAVIDFENRIKELKNREETGRYIVRHYLTMGHYYFENTLALLEDRIDSNQCVKEVNKALNYYVQACAYAKRHVQSRFEFVTNIFRERILFLVKKYPQLLCEINEDINQIWLTHKLGQDLFDEIMGIFHSINRIKVK